MSLSLLIGISAIWVGSYRKRFSVEHFYYIQPDGKPLAEDAILPSPVIGYMDYSVYSTTGRLVAIRYKMVSPPQRLWPEDGDSPRDRWGHSIDSPSSLAFVDYEILARGGSTRFGFGFPEIDGGLDTSSNKAVMLPDWFVAFLFAILPAIWFYRWRRTRRRYAAHLCQICGYDLRATPERCPECGTVAAKKEIIIK